MIGSPISGWLLTFNGYAGVHGWQWLFIIEGLPAVLPGFACLFVLSDGPRQARWLTTHEQDWLAARLADEQAVLAKRHGARLRDGFTPQVLAFALINFCGIVGSPGIGIWMPQIVKAFWSFLCRNRIRLCHALRHRGGGDDALRQCRRAQQTPHRVCRHRLGRRCHRFGAQRVCRLASAGHGGADGDGVRDSRLPGVVLGVADQLSHRPPLRPGWP
jgi:hypothetical protein